MELASKSGCKALFLGLETISQDSLSAANKKHNVVASYREVMERFHYYGMAVQAGIVFGFDHDDRSIFRNTVEYFREIALDSATISVLIPFPNTPLFKRLESEGRIMVRHKFDKKFQILSEDLLSRLDSLHWSKVHKGNTR